MRESKLRPSGRRYSMQNHGSLDSGRIGTHVLKKNSNCDYWKPSWKNTKTVIRIYPGLNPDDPTQFDPFRFSTQPLDFGDWIRTYPAVRSFGDPGITMLLYDPASEEAYDPQTNPANILYRAIETACKNGQGKPEWYPLREFAHGRGRVLSKPTRIGLVQGALFCHNNKEFFTDDSPPRGGAPEDKPIVFELSVSALNAMFELLEKHDEDWKGDPEDWGQYEYGDIVALDKGAYVWLYEKGTEIDDGSKRPAAKKTAFGGSRAKAGGNDTEVKGFECRITKEYKGVPAQIEGEAEEIVKEKVKLWDDVLQFYTHEEQAHLINGCFPPSAILYAFRDHPEWIDEHTKKAAKGAKTVELKKQEDEEAEYNEEADEVFSKPARGGWGAASKSKEKEEEVIEDDVVPSETLDDEEFLEEDDFKDEGAQEAVHVESPVDDTEEAVDAEAVSNDSDEEFDAPPTEAVAPEAAVKALKQARNRSESRQRKSKLK
jgi:hypothetical protein